MGSNEKNILINVILVVNYLWPAKGILMNSFLNELQSVVEWREPHAGRPARTVFRGIWSKAAPTRLEGLRN